MSIVTANARHPVLDKAEWDLVVELLERERREVPLEIQHAATKEYRQQLRDRLGTVDGLLERLRAPA
jgi:hypothetical protein